MSTGAKPQKCNRITDANNDDVPAKLLKTAIRLHTLLGVTTMVNGLVDQALFSPLPAKASGRQEYPLSINELCTATI
jgi:hypothetical protein